MASRLSLRRSVLFAKVKTSLAQERPWTNLIVEVPRLIQLGSSTLLRRLFIYSAAVVDGNFDLEHVKPLLQTVVAKRSDEEIWEQVLLVTGSTLPQTPISRNMGSLVNSSEHCKDIDEVIKQDLGIIFVDVPQFHETIFDNIPELERASRAIFDRCYYRQIPAQRLLSEPQKPLGGLIPRRKLDIGFSQILVPGELKSNPAEDQNGRAALDLAQYAKEILLAQPQQSFTLYASRIHLYLFNRLGAIASTQFNINQDRLKFVSTYPKQEEEGKLIRKVSSKGICNVAQYYHHKTNSAAGKKRSSSQAGTPLPMNKRSRLNSRTKVDRLMSLNRVHRRVVVWNFGLKIYKANSHVALLAALDGCIEGHESLFCEASILHRDISINNLMIDKDHDNPFWPSFLIDLDLAILLERKATSGAMGRTGTRAFMAIGLLVGEEHSFRHNLESFFWVLLWICVHSDAAGHGRVVEGFEDWNFAGIVAQESLFLKTVAAYFQPYYKPLIPWVDRLRRVVRAAKHARRVEGYNVAVRQITQYLALWPNLAQIVHA
ncbi:hypothetical protein GGR54DRAFT_632374 [Hypoxylon sp. NC1633]|nr:hypothetical protein GGR54DRAFT_632374 [Hypoxylon sp. NC1633]